METPLALDKELQKVFRSKAWLQVFRAQLAAQVAPALNAPVGMLKPEYRAREAVAVADAILVEVGMMPEVAQPFLLNVAVEEIFAVACIDGVHDNNEQKVKDFIGEILKAYALSK
jgi:tellurite resistance protein